ncbi:hypothetical protein ES703_36790 [subsurface metagenome]
MEEIQLRELRTQSSSFPDRATFISVHSQATLDRANEFVKTIKTFQKQLDEFFDENISRLHKAHKEAKAQKTQFEEPLKRAETIVKEVIRKYLVEQDNIRREAEEKARQEREKKFEEARELEKEGKKEEAEQIREDETALAPVLPPVVKADGTHLRKHWTWQVTDIDKVPKEYFVLDALKINSIVRTMKGKTNIPGIRAFQESTIATRIK